MSTDTSEQAAEPRGSLATRTLAMPADANPSGDIFGGWVLSQMDIAGGITAGTHAAGRVATVAVDAMTFHRPVYVGDVLCTYADIIRSGRTSIAIHIEAWAQRGRQGERVKVTQGVFTFVAIDDQGRPRPLSESAPEPAKEQPIP
ncbi:acyl-CoA thioesterase [Pelagibius litoralis]|uniref:Acyl-CoA thioesterase n=1 Tax=Pelagibius litoralis TaxID=374515 RepID=A0A967EWK6_9PROT|nr:acyl-CoA thioesterase [Pelagibius litoralis]NIA67248.1 acyl-CoA thioesterase [Pelagibius litoralis]